MLRQAAPRPGDATDNGRIDLLYQRSDATWCVLDFKTNHISALHTLARTIATEQYEETMRRYGHAVEMLVGARPELWLCFVDTPDGVQLHQVEYDEQAAGMQTG